MAAEKEKYYCQKCGKWMGETEFFTYKDKTKTEMCKKCLTMHIDNFDESTFLWLLKKMDVPYLPSEWNGIRDKLYAKNPDKVTSSSVFGRYLSKMKLTQYMDKKTGRRYGWEDSEWLQQKEKEEAEKHAEEIAQREQEAKEKFENGEISEAEYKTLLTIDSQRAEGMGQTAQNPGSVGFEEDDYLSEDELGDPGAELTQDDKIYLAMKWGRLYKPNEWVQLEKMYNEMIHSFDIQDADTINTLLLICKTNLKMNQALDIGDLDGYQKLSRVFDSLRKSAKFTAAQNKEEKNDFVDSVGELITICEREGFIPKYAIDVPQDKVDATLKDMNDYLHKLVTQDLGFGQQIEDALKKIQIQKEMNEAAENEDYELQDEDYVEYLDEVEQQKDFDAEMLSDGDQ